LGGLTGFWVRGRLGGKAEAVPYGFGSELSRAVRLEVEMGRPLRLWGVFGGADPCDAWDGERVELGVGGDKVIGHGGCGEGQVKGVGWFDAGEGTDLCEPLGYLDPEWDCVDRWSGEELTVFCGGEDVAVSPWDDQNFGKHKVTGEEGILGGLRPSDEIANWRMELRVLLEEVDPLHGVEVEFHSPQASRSRRRTFEGPPSSGSHPFMLPSRLQSRFHQSSRVRGRSGWGAVDVGGCGIGCVARVPSLILSLLGVKGRVKGLLGKGVALGVVRFGGGQFGRCGCAFTPACGRVVASATRFSTARLKRCAFDLEEAL
jgi:hypothetical protein